MNFTTYTALVCDNCLGNDAACALCRLNQFVRMISLHIQDNLPLSKAAGIAQKENEKAYVPDGPDRGKYYRAFPERHSSECL